MFIFLACASEDTNSYGSISSVAYFLRALRA